MVEGVVLAEEIGRVPIDRGTSYNNPVLLEGFVAEEEISTGAIWLASLISLRLQMSPHLESCWLGRIIPFRIEIEFSKKLFYDFLVDLFFLFDFKNESVEVSPSHDYQVRHMFD